jgi:serine phosphatase RsbU (regulator of sigma subunit)/DNA-binding response OmpR family regulator
MSFSEDTVTLKIMVLDDDPVVRQYVKESLPGCFIFFASTVHEFYEALPSVRPDLFLLDVHLPDGNGIDLCRKVKQTSDFKNSFFVIMTSRTDNETIELAYKSGADDYVRKPFLPFELYSKLKIFDNIKKVRDNLFNAYQKQLDQNVQLFKLSYFIQKNLSRTNVDDIFFSSEELSSIIDASYVELVKVKEDVPLGVFQKVLKKGFSPIEFKELMNQHYLFRGNDSLTKFFKGKKYDDVFCCLCGIKFRNSIYGYILMESSSPFNHSDKELISLYVDYINLINGNLSYQRDLHNLNEAYKKEISIIRKLEVSKLPDFGNILGYDIAFSFMPAQDLSGDFFDGFFIEEDVYQVVLCDVSGHGIASSFVGNQIRTLFREKSVSGKKPSEIAAEVNNAIYSELSEYRYYCTAQIIQIYLDSGQIIFLSAAHPEAILYNSKSAKIEILKNNNPAIGLFHGEIYKEEIIKFNEGDFIFLYTDGLTEEHSIDEKEMFGIERVVEGIKTSKNYGANEILHHCLGDFYEFNGYRPQHDDITLLCIKKI